MFLVMPKLSTNSSIFFSRRLPRSWVNAFLVTTLLFAFFPIKFNFLPVDSARIFYLLSFFAIPFARVIKVPVGSFVTALVIAFIAMIAVLLNHSDELSMVRICFELVIRYLIVMNILAVLVYQVIGDDWQRMLRIIISVFLVQAFFILAMLLFPSFQSSLLSILNSDAKGLGREGFWRLRQVGVTGWAAYDMAITMLCPLFMMSGLVKGLSTKSSKLQFSFILLSILAAALVAGRSTFIGLTLLIFMSLVLIFSRHAKEVGFFYLKSLSIIALVVGLGVLWLAGYSDVAEVEFFINWAFEIIINFTSGSAETESTNELMKMYYMPPERTFLMGDGRYISENGGFYGATDVGFLRLILFFGVFGTIIFYCFFLLFFYLLFKKLARINLPLSYYMLAYGVLLFVMNFKGAVFVDVIPALSSLFFLYFYFSRRSKGRDLVAGVAT
jgi:hypothetical protein